MNGKYRVNEIASILGVSQTTIYKRFAEMKATMKPHHCKEKGILIFNETALGIFRETISTADTQAVMVAPAPAPDNRMENVEKALLTLAEKMQTMIEENRALRSEVSTLQKAIEYRKPEPPAFATERRIRTQPQNGEVAPSIRAVVMAPTQREVSAWVSLKTSFDDLLGFAFGRG